MDGDRVFGEHNRASGVPLQEREHVEASMWMKTKGLVSHGPNRYTNEDESMSFCPRDYLCMAQQRTRRT